ncbi:hypothetical protein K0M31_016166 [Melipona bicolor]|uniref:Uncharacterized protein n=1 Tax=Melipona bicolor TaxID=60889 RepID=A0AA40G6I7_9HYME|nr:hypothetical protein K0M31_016166 [Melipona bicolor]
MFKRNNIKPLTNITPLKAGITDPDLSHILSFTSLPRLRRRQTHPELLYNYNRKQHIQNIHHYRETDMLYMSTRRSHCKPMPKYRKPKQIQPTSPHKHKFNLTYTVHSH